MKDSSVDLKNVVKVVLSALLLQESKIKCEARKHTPGCDLQIMRVCCMVEIVIRQDRYKRRR